MHDRDRLSTARGLLIAVPLAAALWFIVFVGFVTVYDLPLMPWTAR